MGQFDNWGREGAAVKRAPLLPPHEPTEMEKLRAMVARLDAENRELRNEPFKRLVKYAREDGIHQWTRELDYVAGKYAEFIADVEQFECWCDADDVCSRCWVLTRANNRLQRD